MPLVEVEFGLRDIGKNIAGSLKNVSEKLAGMLSAAVDDLTNLEVHTYTSDNLAKVRYNSETHRFSDEAKLKALTRISLDGDMLNLIPERQPTTEEEDDAHTEVEIDERLWAIHQEMVKLAQDNRVKFVNALAELASKLLTTIK